MEKPFLYLGDNVRAGLNLLESMVEHGVKRIILSSTANLFDKPEGLSSVWKRKRVFKTNSRIISAARS